MSFVLLLYRLWRFTKRKLKTPYNNIPHVRHIIRSIPVIILTILIFGFNVQARQTTRELGPQSLLDELFYQTDEYTVVESSSIPNTIESPAQLLAALEPNSANTASPQLETTEEDLTPVADSSGAIVRQNVTTTQVLSERDSVIEYTVQQGDTISTIAEKHNITTATVLWANHLSDHSIIRPGEKLKILPVSGVMHIVKSGETLLAIANKYDVEPEEVAKANELVSANQLQINQGLIIPGGRPPATETKTTQLANFSQIFTSSPEPEEPSSVSDSGYVWPTPSRRITQYYWVNHKAIDVGGSSNDTIVATKAGRVEFSGWSSNGYGNNVLINHGNGIKTRYAHLSQLWIETGDQVEQGEALGKKGTTGRSTGVHLHFEIIINGVKVNPLSYL